jgi:glucose/mannose-6-phosphate isomerase
MASSPAESVARMRSMVSELPTMVLAGFRSGREVAWPFDGSGGRLYAAGLGASAASADLARAVLDTDASVTLDILRGDELPRAVDKHASVMVVSYSGETTEALRAYDAAGRRKARRLVLTSGGELADRAEDDRVPVVRVPAGLPPRSAVGYLFGGVLGVLDSAFTESVESRLGAAADRLRATLPEFSAVRGPASSLAAGIGGRLPFFVADRSLGAVARRWVTQVEENAKRLAVAQEIPEMLHNAVVGWGSLRPREASRYALVLIERAGEPPVTREGMRYLEDLVRGHQVPVLRAAIPAEEILEAVLLGVALGDLVSLELARRGRVDPFPILAIDRIRAKFAATVGRR